MEGVLGALDDDAGVRLRLWKFKGILTSPSPRWGFKWVPTRGQHVGNCAVGRSFKDWPTGRLEHKGRECGEGTLETGFNNLIMNK